MKFLLFSCSPSRPSLASPTAMANPISRGGFFISYDDRQSIGAKCDYINAQKFRGAMIWELSGDLPTALASFPS
ncbi:MAG: glycosyl hydrolase family 18 protein [Terrimicrobiaceae bacterium]